MNLIIHPAVRGEVVEIAKYYHAIQPKLAESFSDNYDNAVARLHERPLRNPIIADGIRRQRVDRFPYGICYEILDADTIQVLVVRHHHRHWMLGLDRR